MHFTVSETIRSELTALIIEKTVISCLVTVCNVLDTRETPVRLRAVRTWRGEVLDADVTVHFAWADDALTCTAEVEYSGSEHPAIENDLRISIRGALNSARMDTSFSSLDWMNQARPGQVMQ